MLFLKTDVWKSGMEYFIGFVANPDALELCRLPSAVTAGFAASSRNDQRRIGEGLRDVI